MKNSRWISLLILCTGFLLIVVDMTIVNVALPSIQQNLGFSPSGLAWVVNAYLIAFGGLLLLAGRLGDLVGRKRIFLIGLGIFTGASVLCGLSFAQPMLIAARFIQGTGGAASSAVILAMIVTLFPEPLERAKAFGIFSFVASAGAAVGLLAGGVITAAVSWHWIFFVNLPIGLVTAALAARLLEPDRGIGPLPRLRRVLPRHPTPRSRLPRGPREARWLRGVSQGDPSRGGEGKGADVLGAVTVTAALMLGVYAIVQTSEFGLVSQRTVVLGAITVGLLAAFVVRQAVGRNPILPLDIFRSRKVAGANIVQALMTTAFFGFFFLGSLDFEQVLGYGPMEIGLAFLPVAAVMALFSIRLSAQLIGRYGPWAMLVVGQVVVALALVMVAVGPTIPNYMVHLLVPMALLGLGGGLSFPALTMIAMAGVQPSESGLASGLLNTTGQVGGAFGLAVLATVAGARSLDLVKEGTTLQLALADGYHFAWLLAACIVVVTVAITVALLRGGGSAETATAPVEWEAAA
ncbi:MAG TPA: MFS transporter [Candidatus Dormibacteraeota bacterium]|nr:MFS transporter [Candidatus Dormibacteraeota bacterium]